MKVAYIKPYKNEIEFLTTNSDLEFFEAESIADLDQAIRQEIEVLSVFVNYTVDQEALDLLPNLKLIATRSVGYDHIDLKTAAERNITVCRVPSYGTRTVAEYAIALMFALSRNAFRSYTDMRQSSSITNLDAYEGFDLGNKTLGVIGTGAIGQNVCRLAKGIGMKVIAYDINPNSELIEELGVEYMSLDETLSQSDIVTLHVPAIAATHHLINSEKLALMKNGSYLINTARGSVVDTKALVKALQQKHLAGAALDVLEGEKELQEEVELLAEDHLDDELWTTLVADHALIDMPNVIVTPHIAFNTIEAKQEITQITKNNIEAFATGKPQNLVNYE